MPNQPQIIPIEPPETIAVGQWWYDRVSGTIMRITEVNDGREWPIESETITGFENGWKKEHFHDGRLLPINKETAAYLDRTLNPRPLTKL